MTKPTDASQSGINGSHDAGLGEIDLGGKWDSVSACLREEVGEAAFQSWLKPIAIRGYEAGVLSLSVPTRFMRDWIAAHYQDRLTALWGKEVNGLLDVDIIIQPEHSTNSAASRGGEAASGTSSQPRPEVPAQPRRDGMPSAGVRGMGQPPRPEMPAGLGDQAAVGGATLDPRFTFENFVIGKPNEFAYAAAKRVADAPNAIFNPLFLYGGVGLGKTHLMHAIAHHIRTQDSSRSILYLSAEKFMYRFIRALQEHKTVDFKDQFRSVDVLMIDDVQFISGKESTQEEFFHTFNALVDQGRQIVISADKSPSDLEGIEERLKSRLNCGLVADIHATTYELRIGILQSKADGLQAAVPQKVLEYLAHKITSNVRELEGALNRVVAHSQLVGGEISLETTQEVLQDLLRANDRRVTIEEIQKRVAAHFNIRTSDMHSARRARSVARPRQVAMYLAKQLTSRSLPEIGRKFGGRDHTTVMHAVRKVEELREHDRAFAEDVDLLRRMLEG